MRFALLERRVRDLERSIAFYVDGLGFRRLGDAVALADERPGVLLGLGDERVVLRPVPAGVDGATVFAGPDVRFQHAAIVTRDMTAALRRLQAQTSGALVPITHGGPQRLPEASGGATAFKFRDPDGHPLELIEFAAGRAPERWRGRSGGDPTLGIDHVAISVAQAARSIAFYVGLGFGVGGRQVNVGPEQARLDGLDTPGMGPGDVAVEVVALLPPGPPGVHVELLAYRHPMPFVPAVRDAATRAMADRLHWIGATTGGTFEDPDGHGHRWAAAP